MAIMILICAVFYIMYLWDFAIVLLVIMIVLPIVMFVITFITSKQIDVEFAVKSDIAAKNENFPVQLKITSRSFFPVGKAEANIEYFNVFNDEASSFGLSLPIQANNTQSVTFQLSSKYCGMLNIRCSQITLYDPLRIFRFRIGRNIHTEIAVMPEGYEISGTVSYTDRVNEDSSTFSESRPGDDPSEVFDLRGYNPGDKLNRIHWKLSSKKDEFIVKDYSLPVDVPATFFLDLKCYEKSEYTLAVFDTLIETLVSVSQFLLENERSHTIVYYSAKLRCFAEHTVSDTDSLNALMREIIFSAGDSCETPDRYFLDNRSLSLSSFTFVTSVQEQSVITYIAESVDADLKNAVVAVKSVEEAQRLSSNYSDISAIPVVIGRITSSIKDIEL